jgi:hypothetical protein
MPRKSEKPVHTAVRMEPEVFDKLTRIAKANHWSKSHVIRTLIMSFGDVLLPGGRLTMHEGQPEEASR